MNSQLEIKLAPTPETDAMEYFDAMCDPDRVVEADFARKLERERDEWKAKYTQQNKDLGCEMMDPNGTIWDYAKKVQRELTVVTKQRDQLEERLRVELGGHPDSELWGDAGLIAATMRCVDALDTVTEQRDDFKKELEIANYRLKGKCHPDDNGIMADGEVDVKAVTEQRDEAREQTRKAQVENDHNWQAIEMYEAERALADRLALALKMTRWDSPVTCKKAFDAWKEARK